MHTRTTLFIYFLYQKQFQKPRFVLELDDWLWCCWVGVCGESGGTRRRGEGAESSWLFETVLSFTSRRLLENRGERKGTG